MARWEDGVKGLNEQELRLDFAGYVPLRPHAQVGFAREHAGRDRFHAAVDEADRHVRKLAREAREHFWQQGGRHQLRRGDAHDAALERLERGHFVQHGVQIGQDFSTSG